MNIFYFSSDLFASIMAVSMVSLLENNQDFDEIVFYIVDDGISDKTKIRLVEMVDHYNIQGHDRKIKYIEAPAPNDVLKYPFKSRYQMGHSYFRMCIGTLLPESVYRVLCLDCDTLVCGCLNKLWNIEMEDTIMAGVADCMNIRAYKKRFQMADTDVYCNAGVLLVDLEKWRTEKVEERIIQRIHAQEGNVFFFEQTLMNWSCRGKIQPLPPEYNVYTLFWAFSYDNLIKWRKPLDFFSREQIEKAKKRPKIIHFTRNFYMLSRPWLKGCDHPMTNEYLRYKKMTPWKEAGVDEGAKGNCLAYKLWHKLPQNALATGANILYNHVRPRMWWRNE